MLIFWTFFCCISLSQNEDSLYLLQIEQPYQKQIEEGKKYFDQGLYVEAKRCFQNACAIRPDQFYPKDMILRTDQAIARLKSLEYQTKIMDDQFTKGNYADAYIIANEILLLDPNNQRAIETKIASEPYLKLVEKDQRVKHTFDSLIGVADISFNSKEYEDAYKNYSSAQLILPHIGYMSVQLAKIQQIQTEIEFYRLIAVGDSLTKSGDYFEALNHYEYAKKMTFNDTLLDTKIQSCKEQWNALSEIRYPENVDAFFARWISLDSMLAVVQKGLEIAPDNQSLKDAINYFENYVEFGLHGCDVKMLKEKESSILEFYKGSELSGFEIRDDVYGPRCGYFLGDELYIGFIISTAKKNELMPYRVVYQMQIVADGL